MATMAPSRKRNQTIQADSWNPLTEHSSKILERMDPLHIFGRGAKKISFHENKRMPRFQHPTAYNPYGGNIASDYVDRYTTAGQKAAFKREAKSALGTARQFVPAGEKDIVDSLIHVIHGLGLGGKIGTTFGKRLAGIAGDVAESAGDRAIREMAGGRVGTTFGKRLAGIAGDVAESAGDRAIREMAGGRVNRLKKAKRWEGFAVDTANDGLDVAGDTYDLVNRIRNPVTAGLKDMFGWGMSGGYAKGSAEAKAHAAKMHAARRLKYVKGSDASKSSNAKNPWLVFVKEFYEAHPEMTYREALSAASLKYRAELRKKSAQYGGRQWKAKSHEAI
jgi:hypothetical protein